MENAEKITFYEDQIGFYQKIVNGETGMVEHAFTNDETGKWECTLGYQIVEKTFSDIAGRATDLCKKWRQYGRTVTTSCVSVEQAQDRIDYARQRLTELT